MVLPSAAPPAAAAAPAAAPDPFAPSRAPWDVPPGDPAAFAQPAPGAAAAPVDPQTPTPPAPPEPQAPPQVTVSQQEYAALRRAQEERVAIEQEIRQFAAEQHAQRADQERKSARKQALDQAKQIAAGMGEEEGRAYLVNVADQIAEYEAAQAAQAVQQREQARVANLEPIMVQHYVTNQVAPRLGLRPEYAARLAQYPPQYVDRMAPLVLQEQQNADRMAEQMRQWQEQISQGQRLASAQQIGSNGVHQPAAPGATPISTTANGYQPGSLEHLLSKPGVAEAFGYRRS